MESKAWFTARLYSDSANELEVLAPYGLEDQANMLIRPNKRTMRKENYDDMNASFKERWPMVTVLDWHLP